MLNVSNFTLGISAHHMILENGNDHRPFEEKLTKLRQVLERLCSIHRGSRIIWMNQYPTLDYFGPTRNHNTLIHAEKLLHYNKIAQRIFRYRPIYIPTFNSILILTGDFLDMTIMINNFFFKE